MQFIVEGSKFVDLYKENFNIFGMLCKWSHGKQQASHSDGLTPHLFCEQLWQRGGARQADTLGNLDERVKESLFSV